MSTQIRFLQSSGVVAETKVWKCLDGFQVLKCSLWRLYWRSSAPGKTAEKQLIAILDLELIQQKGMELFVPVAGAGTNQFVCFKFQLTAGI